MPQQVAVYGGLLGCHALINTAPVHYLGWLAKLSAVWHLGGELLHSMYMVHVMRPSICPALSCCECCQQVGQLAACPACFYNSNRYPRCTCHSCASCTATSNMLSAYAIMQNLEHKQICRSGYAQTQTWPRRKGAFRPNVLSCSPGSSGRIALFKTKKPNCMVQCL